MRTVLFATFFIAFSSFSQKIGFGPSFGVNFLAVEKDDFGVNMKPGYYFGGHFFYELQSNLRLETGLYFSHKRHTYSTADTSTLMLFGLEDLLPLDNIDLKVYDRTKSSVSQFYLELPVMATYMYERFQASLGGFVGYQLLALTKTEEERSIPALQTIDLSALDPDGFISALIPPGYSRDFTESSSTSGLNSFDFGLRAGIGMEVESFGIHGYYNFRLAQYRSQSSENSGVHRHYGQLVLRYSF